MQLIIILLATVSILTFLSGAIVFFGSTKGNRVRSAWYFAAAIFATIWMTSISVFLMAGPSWGSIVKYFIEWTFISAMFLDVAFLAFVSWKAKYGRILTAIFFLFALTVSVFIVAKPDLMFTSYNISPAGNTIALNVSPVYIAYIAFFATILPAMLVNLLQHYSRTTSKRKRSGDIVTMASFGVSSLITLAFDVVMPLMGRWDLVWMGPLALAITIIAVYYTILRYRTLNLNSIWLKFFSYIVIVASIAIIYMIIFSIIFAGMFRGATPSSEVIILNFVMVFIFVILMPAINNLVTYVRSLINGDPEETKEKAEK